MTYLNEMMCCLEPFSAPEGMSCGNDCTTSSRDAESGQDHHELQLDQDELIAAYLAREANVQPIFKLLFEMSDLQRRLALSMLQCVAAGAFGCVPASSASS